MRRVLKLILHHPGKLWLALLCVSVFYGYARILALQYAVGKVQYSIYRYPTTFPHAIFLPLFYGSVVVAFVFAMYHDLMVLHSGLWKYVLPFPLAVKGRNFRIIGIPLYAFAIGVVEALQKYRNPFMKSDLSRLAAYLDVIQDHHSFLDDHKLRAIMLDIKWNAWLLKTSDPTAFSALKLPLEVALALVVCSVYGISLFCREPRHDGEELREATRNHDIARVRVVLARGTPPNSHGSDGATALHICAQQAMGNVAKVLLEHKADPNAQDRLGFTPLHWAVQMRREEVSPSNRVEIIRLLLANGASATRTNANDWTPLMIARKKENEPALDVLKEVLGDDVVLLGSSDSHNGMSSSSSASTTSSSSIDGRSASEVE